MELGSSVEALRELLITTKPRLVRVIGVPDGRLAPEVEAMKRLDEPSAPTTVGELRELLHRTPPTGVQPEVLWNLGNDLPYVISLTCSDAENCRFDVLCRQRPATGEHSIDPTAARHAVSAESWEAFANRPVERGLTDEVASRLRSYVQQHLPEYMAPSAWVVLDSLPITGNGKVDRSALPDPDGARPASEQPFVEPQTEIETELAAIWCEVLSVDRVGSEDNFFNLGGHSLLATQVVSRIRAQFSVELPLRKLFEAPTLSALARNIVSLQAKGQDAASTPGEAVRVPAVAADLQGLSDDEVDSLLREMLPPSTPSTGTLERPSDDA